MKPDADLANLNPSLLATAGGAALADAPADAAGSSVDLPAAAARGRVGDFVELAKPRLNFLVLVTTMVGYAMAHPDWSNWPLLLHALIGTALTAASASVLNQYWERDFDALMPRTSRRPLPAGRVGPVEALAFGVFTGLFGLAELYLFVNPTTSALGAITLASYVFLYTPMKRWTTLCTVVGAIPGALPPVMGVTAGTVPGVATLWGVQPIGWALFGILFFWQMPHFLAIAILYKDDYARGGFKMLPCVDPDLVATSRQMLLYTLALIPVTLTPTLIGAAGPGYFVAAFMMGLAFLGFAAICVKTRRRADARQVFLASILYLPCLLAALMVDKQ